jgi:hypothetical protein
MTEACLRHALVASALLLFATQAPAGDDDLPWAFNAPRAEGYSIDLLTVDPAPGTPLVAGATVEFSITVSYSLSAPAYKTAAIFLVFQDEEDRSAKADDAEVVLASVSDPQGSVTLTDTVTVPKRAKELRLFVPLVPSGLEETNGEVTIRYPIKKK